MTRTDRPILDYRKAGAQEDADGRLHSSAFARNHEPIWDATGPWLTQQTGDVLEFGSGTGQHCVAFAQRSPQLIWWPSDINDAHLRSIAAWRTFAGAGNVRDPQRIDLTEAGWIAAAEPRGALVAIQAVNLLHIAPWALSEQLLAGAAQKLRPNGRLFVYGPFRRDGRHTAPSNERFDAALRSENPDWGVRDMTQIASLGAARGLRLLDAVPMPSDNFTLVFERTERRR